MVDMFDATLAWGVRGPRTARELRTARWPYLRRKEDREHALVIRGADVDIVTSRWPIVNDVRLLATVPSCAHRDCPITLKCVLMTDIFTPTSSYSMFSVNFGYVPNTSEQIQNKKEQRSGRTAAKRDGKEASSRSSLVYAINYHI